MRAAVRRRAHPDDQIQPLARRDRQRGVHLLADVEDAVADAGAPLVRDERRARRALAAVEEELALLEVEAEVDVERDLGGRPEKVTRGEFPRR